MNQELILKLRKKIQSAKGKDISAIPIKSFIITTFEHCKKDKILLEQYNEMISIAICNYLDDNFGKDWDYCQ